MYFVATELPLFVMCGSAVHVLDRRQPTDQPTNGSASVFYAEAVEAYAQKVSELADEAAISDPYFPDSSLKELGGLNIGMYMLYRSASEERGWSGPVRLTGHARVLRISDHEGHWMILATPLCVEYSSSIRSGPGKARSPFRQRRR